MNLLQSQIGFTGSSEITLPNGSTTSVKNLKIGDKVLNPSGKPTKIRKIVVASMPVSLTQTNVGFIESTANADPVSDEPNDGYDWIEEVTHLETLKAMRRTTSKFDLTQKEATVAGMFVADGNLNCSLTKGNRFVKITIIYGDKKKVFFEAQDGFSSIYDHSSGNGTKVGYISIKQHPELAEFIFECVDENTKMKVIPAANLSKENRINALMGYLAGDGHVIDQGHTYSASSTSLSLLLSMQVVAREAGFTHTRIDKINPPENGYFVGERKIKSHKQSYRLYISDKSSDDEIKIKRIEPRAITRGSVPHISNNSENTFFNFK